jgi:hypothetical protein
MFKQLTFVFATLALSAIASAQIQDDAYQIGYAANLNIGDSVVNISNDGASGGFYPNTLGVGNTCVNVYTFDPAEEMVSCCACLVTPNALVSLSAKNDLINNVLTPAIPTSIVVKLFATVPGTTSAGAYTVCNPSLPNGFTVKSPSGMLAWGTTLEPSATPGTYGPVNVPFINSSFLEFGPGFENTELYSICGILQAEGSGYGQCSSCALGALSGTKQ